MQSGLIQMLVMLIIAVLVQGLLDWALRARAVNLDDRRRLLVGSRNLLVLACVMGLFFIWLPELKHLGVYVLAAATATVIAMKELLVGVHGAVLKSVSRAYQIGDRIEINGARGEVVDFSLLSTSLLEVGQSHQFTGRAIVVPNSWLISHALVNETHLGEYGLQVLEVPLCDGADWKKHEEALLLAASTVCANWMVPVRQHMAEMEGKHAISAPSIEPRVQISFADGGGIRFLLRYPAPAAERVRTEQAIIRHYLGTVNCMAERSAAPVVGRIRPHGVEPAALGAETPHYHPGPH